METVKDPTRVCPKCGASDWTTRNRCNPCDAKKARAKWAADPETARAKDREKHRRWRAANPDKNKAAADRDKTRRHLYGVTPEVFDAMLAGQAGPSTGCARRPRT